MRRRVGFWDLLASGAAIGGTGAWALAAAARVGLLRALLDLFPRSSWDPVTWGLIPVLLLLPPVFQGAVVGYLSERRAAGLPRGIGGSVVGTVLAAGAIGGGLLAGVRYLPSPAVALLARTLPAFLIVGFLGLMLTGWVVAAGVLVGAAWVRWASLPLGIGGTALAWILAHGRVLALSYVLEGPEANGLFVSVALGGALGAAWSIAHRADVS